MIFLSVTFVLTLIQIIVLLVYGVYPGAGIVSLVLIASVSTYLAFLGYRLSEVKPKRESIDDLLEECHTCQQSDCPLYTIINEKFKEED
jgi:hypothetical protein